MTPKLTNKMAIAKFFRNGEGLKDMNDQIKQLTEEDVAELGPACIAALTVAPATATAAE